MKGGRKREEEEGEQRRPGAADVTLTADNLINFLWKASSRKEPKSLYSLLSDLRLQIKDKYFFFFSVTNVSCSLNLLLFSIPVRRFL